MGALDSGHTIFIVDDDEAFADSLASMLHVKGYSTRVYTSGLAFLESHDRDTPGCLLLDVQLPDINGLDLQDRLHANGSLLSIIVLSGQGDIPIAVEAIRSGAIDFIEKPVNKDLLYKAIGRAMDHMKDMATKAFESTEARALVARLSQREQQVFELLIQGKTNKAIGSDLGISPRTVEMHRTHLMLKMRSESLPHLVRMGLAAGVDLQGS